MSRTLTIEPNPWNCQVPRHWGARSAATETAPPLASFRTVSPSGIRPAQELPNRRTGGHIAGQGEKIIGRGRGREQLWRHFPAPAGAGHTNAPGFEIVDAEHRV